MNNILIVGAGRLGKGFIGETFYNAGWNLSFLDKDPRVIDELNKNGKYEVTVHTIDSVYQNEINGYNAYLTSEDYSMMASFLETDLIMMPIYPEDFEEAAEYLSHCFETQYRENPDVTKTIICLTNKNRLIDKVEKYFLDHLSDEAKIWFKDHVYIRDAIIRRSTDAETNYSTNLKTTAVASLIIQEPIYSNLDDVEWMELRDNVEDLKDIKVFTVNGPHAVTAYYGYLKGYDDILTASNDSEIAELVDAVHDISVLAVLNEFPVTRDEVNDLEYLPKAKNEMPDAISRVAYDPIRKVSPGDRLMGVIEICEKYGIDYDPITKGLACAFLYRNNEDPSAIKINKEIQELGYPQVVSKYIGRKDSDPVVKSIVKYIEILEKKLVENIEV